MGADTFYLRGLNRFTPMKRAPVLTVVSPKSSAPKGSRIVITFGALYIVAPNRVDAARFRKAALRFTPDLRTGPVGVVHP